MTDFDNALKKALSRTRSERLATKLYGETEKAKEAADAYERFEERFGATAESDKALNGGIDPSVDPEIMEDWNGFSEEEKNVARLISKELQVARDGNIDSHAVMNRLSMLYGKPIVEKCLNGLLKMADKNRDNHSMRNAYARVVVDQSPSWSPGTMIFKKTLEDFDRMFETKIMRVGENYKSMDYEKASPIPFKDARICLLPNPLPKEWRSSFEKEVSEEILLGLPFQTTWIEATGSWETGTSSSIQIHNSEEEGTITIGFCGAFLQTRMSGSTPVLQVKAVMAAGNTKKGESTIFISSYILTTHMIKWIQDRINKTDFSESAYSDEEYKAYPILGPSVFPIVGFLPSLHSKEIRMGSERVNERLKIGRGKGKEVFKIKQVVHVALHRKDYPLPKISGSGREIDWTHRWEVMGHWRKISENGIGKNASGEYGVRGFTWVSPHERGPEDKPVVKKIRVVEP